MLLAHLHQLTLTWPRFISGC